MSTSLSLSERKTSSFLETVPEASTSGKQDLDLLEKIGEINPRLLKPLVSDKSPPLLTSALVRSPPRTPTSQEGPLTHTQILQQMETMRQEMHNGIEEMKLRIYQIQYCEKSLGDETLQSGHEKPSSEIQKCPVQESCHFEDREDHHWGSIASAMLQNELIYESSSKSSGMDPSHPSSTSQDPHTPFNEDSNGQSCSPFPLNYTTAHVEISSINSLKSDVILNLNTTGQSHQESTRIRDEAPRGFDRLLGMFCIGLGPQKKLNSMTTSNHRRRDSSQVKMFGKRLEMGKMFGRMGQKTTPFSLSRKPDRVRIFSGKGARKFTEKYPIEETGPHFTPISETFCPFIKSQTVCLDSSLTRARIPEGESRVGRVFSQDGIQDGITRFSVTSHSLVGECFVGIVSKDELAINEGDLQHWGSAVGWSNAGEIFGARIHHEVMDGRQNRSSFLTSSFQVVVDTRAGTVHLRVQHKSRGCVVSSQICEFTEYELHFEPRSGNAWHLGVQWRGPDSELRLNSVEKWQ